MLAVVVDVSNTLLDPSVLAAPVAVAMVELEQEQQERSTPGVVAVVDI